MELLGRILKCVIQFIPPVAGLVWKIISYGARIVFRFLDVSCGPTFRLIGLIIKLGGLFCRFCAGLVCSFFPLSFLHMTDVCLYTDFPSY